MNNENNDNDITENLLPKDNNIETTPLLSNEKQEITVKQSKVIKITVAASLIVFLFLSNNYFTYENVFSLPLIQPNECYTDLLFTLSNSIHTFFMNNIESRNALLIFSSFLADSTIILGMFIWTFRFKDEGLLISLTLFYVVRFIIMELILFNYPKEYIFEYPGMRSIFVSYLKTNDFFFSGHTGFPIIIFLDFIRKKYYLIAYLSLFTLIMQFFTMLVLHGHYSIDLLVGTLVGIYVYFKCNKFLKWYYKRLEKA